MAKSARLYLPGIDSEVRDVIDDLNENEMSPGLRKIFERSKHHKLPDDFSIEVVEEDKKWKIKGDPYEPPYIVETCEYSTIPNHKKKRLTLYHETSVDTSDDNSGGGTKSTGTPPNNPRSPVIQIMINRGEKMKKDIHNGCP